MVRLLASRFGCPGIKVPSNYYRQWGCSSAGDDSIQGFFELFYWVVDSSYIILCQVLLPRSIPAGGHPFFGYLKFSVYPHGCCAGPYLVWFTDIPVLLTDYDYVSLLLSDQLGQQVLAYHTVVQVDLKYFSHSCLVPRPPSLPACWRSGSSLPYDPPSYTGSTGTTGQLYIHNSWPGIRFRGIWSNELLLYVGGPGHWPIIFWAYEVSSTFLLLLPAAGHWLFECHCKMPWFWYSQWSLFRGCNWNNRLCYLFRCCCFVSSLISIASLWHNVCTIADSARVDETNICRLWVTTLRLFISNSNSSALVRLMRLTLYCRAFNSGAHFITPRICACTVFSLPSFLGPSAFLRIPLFTTVLQSRSFAWLLIVLEGTSLPPLPLFAFFCLGFSGGVVPSHLLFPCTAFPFWKRGDVWLDPTLLELSVFSGFRLCRTLMSSVTALLVGLAMFFSPIWML